MVTEDGSTHNDVLGRARGTMPPMARVVTVARAESFGPGARNKLHTHTSEQVLFVTEGVGYVGTEDETARVSVGDTAFIPAGEKHWHGATDESSFSHVALLSPTSKTAIFE